MHSDKLARATSYKVARIAILAGLFLAIPTSVSVGQQGDEFDGAVDLTLEEARDALELSDAEAMKRTVQFRTKSASVQTYLEDNSHADRIRDIRRRYDPKIIYGPDDRMDYGEAIEAHPELVEVFDTSIAMFDARDIMPSEDGMVTLKTVSLAEEKKLCPEERFRNQAVGAFCSGTLIAKDKVLTAGHCIREISNDVSIPRVDRIGFVFGFHAYNKDDIGRTKLDESHIFYGASIVDGVLQSSSLEDWAIVKLSRDVPPNVAQPLQRWGSSSVEKGDDVYVVGYPTGMPFKYAPNSNVKQNDKELYFTANLDTFGGNSGSGVFRSKELVGILVRGDTDYVWDRKKNCRVVNVCPTSGCRGEHIMRASAVPKS